MRMGHRYLAELHLGWSALLLTGIGELAEDNISLTHVAVWTLGWILWAGEEVPAFLGTP